MFNKMNLKYHQFAAPHPEKKRKKKKKTLNSSLVPPFTKWNIGYSEYLSGVSIYMRPM